MTQPIEVPLHIDTSGYIQSIDQAQQATMGFGQSLASLGSTAAGFQAHALSSPFKALLLPMAGASAGAAAFQQQISQLNATQAVTGISSKTLATGIQSLARSFPIGVQGATQIVNTFLQLGVSAQNSAQRVVQLSTEMVKLQGATGTAAPALAQGLTQLARAFDNSSLDPNKISAIGDSLTTVSKTAGASADSILSFANMLSPMAKAAGIGQTSLLGISAAMARLSGGDSIGSATAVNKMIGDLNQSFREGSSQMSTYAQIAGTTVQKFRAMYAANPSKALTTVVNSIANAGPTQGPTELNMLGLDGVRTQRYLQELIQSGGLSSSIATAVGAYGSGSTNRAAAAGYAGLNAQLMRLSSSAQSVGVNLGTPLLRPLGVVAGAANSVVGGVGRVLGAGPVQGAMNYGADALIGTMLLGKASTPLSIASLGRTAWNSNFMNSARGSYQDMKANYHLAQGRSMGLEGESLTNYVEQQATGGGGGFIRNIFGKAYRGANVGLQNYFGMMGANFQASYTHPDERGNIRFGTPGQSDAVDKFKGTIKELGTSTQGLWSTFKTGVSASRDLTKEIAAEGTATKTLGVLMRTTAQGTMAAGSMLKSGTGSLLGSINPWMAGGAAVLGLGALAWNAHSQQQAALNAQIDSAASADPNSLLNKYNDALGLATVSTNNFADALNTAASSSRGGGKTPSGYGNTVGPSQLQAAWGNKVVNTFAGTPNSGVASSKASRAAVAAQITAMNASGQVTPTVWAQIGSDLVNSGFSPKDAEAILRMANPSGNAPVSGNAALNFGAVDQGMGVSYPSSPLLGGNGLTLRRVGGPLSSTQRSALSYQTQAVSAVAARQIGQGVNADYVSKNEYANFNKEYTAALKTNNQSVIDYVMHDITATLTGGRFRGTFTPSSAQLQAGGGFIGAFAASQGKNATWFDKNAQNAHFSYSSTQYANLLDSLPKGSGDHALAQGLFGVGVGKGSSWYAVNKAIGLATTTEQGSPAAQIQAVDKITQRFESLGIPLDEAAAKLYTFANRVGDGTAAQSLLMQAYQNIMQRIIPGGLGNADLVMGKNGSPISGSGFQSQYVQAQANTVAGVLKELPASDTSSQAYMTARGQAVSLTEGLDQQMAQYLQQYQQYTVQLSYAQQDYYRQSSRAQYQYQIQMTRSQQDYLINLSHENRDFQRSTERSIQDFAAQALNPYTRVVAQPVFDAGQLLGNLQQQAQQMSQQLDNLKVARQHGLSNAVIQMLGLNDPNNAQQLSVLVNNMLSDPNLVSQLNNTAAQRLSMSKVFVTDPSNTSYQRSLQDFKTSLGDQKKQYDLQMNRAKQDFQTNMTWMNQDYQTQLERMGQAYQMSQEEWSQNAQTLYTATLQAMAGQIPNWSAVTQNGMKAMTAEVSKNAKTWNTVLGFGGQGLSAASTAYAAAILGAVGQGIGDAVTKLGGTPGGGGGGGGGGGSGTGYNSGGNTGAYYSAGSGSQGVSRNIGHIQTSSATPSQHHGSQTYPGTPAKYGGYEHKTGTWGQFATEVLAGLGLPTTKNNIGLLTGWMTAESQPGASISQNRYWFNPLNTTYPQLPGSFAPQPSNPANVLQFPNWGEGVYATAYSIAQNGWATHLLSAGNTSPEVFYSTLDQSNWGTHGAAAKDYGYNVGAMVTGPSSNEQKYAHGGVTYGPTRALLGEGAFGDLTLPLGPEGVNFMARAISQASGQMINTAGHSVAVHYHSTQVDQGVHIASVEVKSNDPDEFGRQMAARTRKNNLVGR